MRADRLLSILLMLQTHRRMTTSELAERMEVSPRTIHRDMDALSGSGVPVVGKPGHGGGWELLEPYRTDLTGLTLLESQTMFLDALPQPLSALGMDQAARSARIKLLAALSHDAQATVEQARQRLYIDPTGWRGHMAAAPEHLSTLQDAVWMDRMIQITYRRADGQVVERIVSPLGLVAKGQTWYLVGAVDDGFRTYRISRVVDAQIEEEPVKRPADFDLRSYWEQSTSDFQTALPSFEATARVSKDLLNRLRFGLGFARTKHIGETCIDGWTPVRIDFGIEDEALGFVLRFGGDIQSIEPDYLIEGALARAKLLIERFGKVDR